MTSRLGSVFPFLLVLVDLQYEGESYPALAGGAGARARPPGASPSAYGASLEAARAAGREPRSPRGPAGP